MYFEELQRMLIGRARERVRAGEVTERGLARMCNISQPHMHNVLKDIRSLSNASADRLMQALQLSVSDLLWRVSEGESGNIDAVPIIRNRIGPGSQAILTVFRGNMPMPSWLLRNLIDPVTARLAPDLVLPGALAANDLVLLDQNPALRCAPNGGGLWIVAEEAGLRARYLRMSGARPCIANEVTLKDPALWLPVARKGQNMLEVVRARIVWISREMETDLAGPPDPAHASD